MDVTSGGGLEAVEAAGQVKGTLFFFTQLMTSLNGRSASFWEFVMKSVGKRRAESFTG